MEIITSIKILGRDGCRNCSNMYQNIVDLVAEKGVKIDVLYVTDLQKVMAYGVLSLPGFVVNEKVVSYGKILSKAELEKMIFG